MTKFEYLRLDEIHSLKPGDELVSHIGTISTVLFVNRDDSPGLDALVFTMASTDEHDHEYLRSCRAWEMGITYGRRRQ